MFKEITSILTRLPLATRLHRHVNLNALVALVRAPRSWSALTWFKRDFDAYRTGRSRAALPELPIQLCPLLSDRTVSQDDPGMYFFQDTWGAQQVFRAAPKSVVDVGSTTLLVGVISQYCDVVSVDVRPMTSSLPGLRSVRGTFTELPFAPGEVSFLLSLCVIEHVGLGRYGDPVLPDGPERAFAEVRRVLAAGAVFAFSVPVGATPCVTFNAHRVFTEAEILAQFPGWTLVDRRLLDKNSGAPVAMPPDGKGEHAVGCFSLRKPAA